MDNILYLSVTPSTNLEAYQLALGNCEHGFGVIADSQSEGRGRLGRDWDSPSGTGLYCSIVLRPKLPSSQFPQITLTAGLALCQMIESLGIKAFGLKWPNDLYCKGKKCGGILVESSPLHESDKNLFVIIGIGLNVNTGRGDFPKRIQDTATSVFIETGRQWDIMDLYKKLHTQLLCNLAIHEEQGFTTILNEWRKRDVLLGKKMQWVTYDKQLITGRGMGPDANGQLLARDSAGNMHAILSGDVTLAKKENGEH